MSKLLSPLLITGLILTRACIATAANPPGDSTDDWPSYGHDPGGMRYSPLTQINRENVAKLKIAWIFHTGDISDGKGQRKRSGFETTPLVVDGTLYLTTPFNRVIALDPEIGKQRWAYDPKIDLSGIYGDGLINRGVATLLDPTRPATQPCRRRLFEATLDARLIALDAATGAPCADFGKAGEVSLRDVPGFRPGWYHMTSAPAVIEDIVVVGSAIDDNGRVDMPAGVVRAFDARSGALRWSWDPIPPNPASSTTSAKRWKSGAANAWSIMAVDPERDLVFVPTGASTPLLATLPHNGQKIPVVIQSNKTGFIYVLNRDTGTPVFPVEERPVPQSDVPGEVTSPTQPIPVAPPPVTPQKLSPDDAWGLTPSDRETCRKWMAGMGNNQIFTPPALHDIE